MIISHSRKFIFLKTRKTASTSVEIALSASCEDGDVITPITPIDEAQRVQLGRACQNFGPATTEVDLYIGRLASGDVPAEIPRALRRTANFSSHMPLRDLLNKVQSPATDYSMISIERHPYEKAISYANFIISFDNYKRGQPLVASLEDIRNRVDALIEDGTLGSKISNWSIYSLDGVVRATHMLRYEHLAEDFSTVCSQLGLRAVSLPKTKEGGRDRQCTGKQILSQLQKDAIQQACAAEFDYFGFDK